MTAAELIIMNFDQMDTISLVSDAMHLTDSSYVLFALMPLVWVHLFYFVYMLVKQRTQPSLPLRKINETCIICLEDIRNEVQLVCSHSYCAGCIIAYGKLRYDLCDLECPMCRRISKKIHCQFEKNEENKTTYEEITHYNNDLMARSSLFLGLDLFRIIYLYVRNVTNLSNHRYDRHRKGLIVSILSIFLFIVYPLTYGLEMEFVEDLIFYVSLVVFIGEFFYRTIKESVNLDTDDSIEESNNMEFQ
jgi:hypothetical protein